MKDGNGGISVMERSCALGIGHGDMDASVLWTWVCKRADVCSNSAQVPNINRFLETEALFGLILELLVSDR